MYGACVLSLLLYCAECWATLKPDLDTLCSFHLRCIPSVMGISQRNVWDERLTRVDVLERWNQSQPRDIPSLLTLRRMARGGLGRLCECMRSVPRVNYCLAPYILSVQCAARGKGGAMLRGRIWQRWASTNGMTWPRIDGNGGPLTMFCPRPNPFVSPWGYLVPSVAVSSPGVVCLVINASMSTANPYQNRKVADNVLPGSAGFAVPEVWRSTSAPTPGCSPRRRLGLRAGRRCLPFPLRLFLRRRVCGSPSHAARPTVGPVVGAAALLVDSKSIAAKDGSLVVPIELGP